MRSRFNQSQLCEMRIFYGFSFGCLIEKKTQHEKGLRHLDRQVFDFEVHWY